MKTGLFGWLKSLFHKKPEPVPDQIPALTLQPTQSKPDVTEAKSMPVKTVPATEALRPTEHNLKPVSLPEKPAQEIIKPKETLMKDDVITSVYMNRELSWLRFNERVLEEAENQNNPLCERLTFASIYQTNLDEFFMVRVGSLVDQRDISPLETDGKTNLTAKQQLDAITDRVAKVIPRRDAVYKELMGQLEKEGIRLVDFHNIGEEESKRLEAYFMKDLLPFIEPNVRSPS